MEINNSKIYLWEAGQFFFIINIKTFYFNTYILTYFSTGGDVGLYHKILNWIVLSKLINKFQLIFEIVSKLKMLHVLALDRKMHYFVTS